MERGEFNIISEDFDIEKCKLAARKGNPEAQHSLAVCYWWGYHGLKKDAEKAFRFASKAAEQELPEALDFLGDCYRDGKKVTMADKQKAFEYYKKAAEQDYTEAIYDLGKCYIEGCGTEKDEKKGLGLLEKAADRGFGMAFSCLADYYIDLDDKKAFELYQKGNELGDSKSKTGLAICYLIGIGTSEDREKGIELLIEAADECDEEAINILAAKYKDIGEYEKAFELYKKGQLLENAESQTKLGLCYLKGLGTEEDDQEAFNLIEDAAIRFNYCEAWFWLSRFYAEGVVVGKNQKKADLYYQKAIENGYVEPESDTKTLEDYYNENDDSIIEFSKTGAINYKTDKEKVQSCIVFIENHGEDGAGEGSGYIISPDGYIATCEHVIRDAERIFIKITGKNKKKKVFKGTVVKANTETDTAIIKIENAPELPFIELDDREESDIEEDVVIYGYPLGSRLNDDVFNLNISFAKGNVASNQVIDGVKKTMLDISAKHGNSGSPIISCKTGKVVGALKGIVPGQEAWEEVNYMMPVCYLHDLLHELTEEEKTTVSKQLNKTSEELQLDKKASKKWADVKRLLRKAYKVAVEENNALAFDFTLDKDRTQRVFVELAQTSDREQWVKISSCLGLIDISEINDVLKMLDGYCWGGLVFSGEKHYISHSLLLSTSSESTLISPIATLAQLADEIEEKFTGGDQY